VTIQNLLTRLSTFVDDSPPKEVFQAIQTFKKLMEISGHGTHISTKRSLNSTQFTKMQTHLQGVLKEKKQEQLALLLSNIGELHLQAQEYIGYFDDFVKEATKIKGVNVRRLNQLQSQMTSECMVKQEEVRSMYQEIAHILDVPLAKEERV
jgi:hypothetical protein